MEKNNTIFDKYPLGFKIYLVLVLTNYFFKICFFKQIVTNSVFLLGLDPQTIQALSLETGIQDFPVEKILGNITGLIIGLFIVWKVFMLKNWARITLIVFTAMNLFTYFFKKDSLISFFNLVNKADIWPGYVIFWCLIFYNIIFSIFIVYYFQRSNVKKLFVEKS